VNYYEGLSPHSSLPDYDIQSQGNANKFADQHFMTHDFMK
jgi:hypothetical protein